MPFKARKIYYTIPPSWRFLVRRLYYLPLDTWEALTGKRDELTPPRGMIFTGGGDFRKTGETLLGYFRDYCGLAPGSNVLDIGSGIGRIAIPLTRFLAETGKYDGFDVVEKGVKWCQEHISKKFPHFHFQYIPLDNDLYRSGGADPAHFKFPYADETYHLVVVNSVFTHMVPKEVDHYLSEIRRVMKPGGCCYATFFLYDKNEQNEFPAGFSFPHDHGYYRLMDESVKSANVAFDITYLKELVEQKYRFRIRHFFKGSWSGLPREDCKEFQDILILEAI